MARAGLVLQLISCIRIKGDNVGKITWNPVVVDLGGRRKQSRLSLGLDKNKMERNTLPLPWWLQDS